MGSVSIFILVLVRSLLMDDRNTGTRACTKRASVIRRILRNSLTNRIKRRSSAMVNALVNEDVTRQERTINGIRRLIRALRAKANDNRHKELKGNISACVIFTSMSMARTTNGKFRRYLNVYRVIMAMRHALHDRVARDRG